MPFHLKALMVLPHLRETAAQFLRLIRLCGSGPLHRVKASARPLHVNKKAKRFFKGRAVIQPQKVLIVDDEYLIRWALAQSLSEAGYEVTAAEDGRKGLEAAQRVSFDFVVTDLAMPGLDGWQLLDMLLRLQTPPRVIVITVQGEENCQRKVKDRGGWAYVEKDRLIPGVREALEAASGE